MYREELEEAKRLAEKASEVIMEIRDKGAEVETKADGSPVTQADLAADAIIVEGLHRAFPNDAILTEESEDDLARLDSSRVWIVDPIDGTKEFIKKNGEFTVNIALVVDTRPVVGVVAVPAQGKVYAAARGEGATLAQDGKTHSISPSEKEALESMTVVVSKSHRTEKDESFAKHFAEMRPAGSSVKGCLVAEGAADVYFRSGPQHEWDICAMDAVIREAGAEMTRLNGEPLTYNNEDTLLHGFIVSNGRIHKQLLSILE